MQNNPQIKQVDKIIDANKSDLKDVKEFSILNQAVYLFRRQDTFLTNCQEQIYVAKTNQDLSGRVLVFCLAALEQAVLPTKWAVSKESREKIENTLIRINKKLKAYSEGQKNKEKYNEIVSDLQDAIEALYKANQLSNLGVPMEMKLDPVEKFELGMD